MKYFLYYCLFIIVIIIFAYINSSTQTENFTPKIREMYRPIVRNTRLVAEGFYNKTTNNISNLFKKIGIV